jgi:hypothetical protein
MPPPGQQQSPPNFECQNYNDPFYTTLKISGKVKRPNYLMLGSSIGMDFNSSGHAKD